MERRINKILKEMVERKSKPLNESIKLFKSNPVVNKKEGSGYWIYISSDNPIGGEFKDEVLGMTKELGLTDNVKFFKDRGFVPPQHTNSGGLKAGVNPETGQWGYGYFITKNKENSPGYVEGKLDNLKELVRDYNNKKSLENDVATGELTLKQVGQIQNLTSAIENTLDKEMNPETKAKLEQYLDDLSNAIEQDEVFDFLTQKYNEASKFERSNKSAGRDYSITNSMIILAADPGAIIAGQKDFWEGRGYKIKESRSYGISIWSPKAGTTQQTAKGILSKPGAWDEFKKEKGVDAGTKFSDYIKTNRKANTVDVALSAIDQKAVRTRFNRDQFYWGRVYTDTMVEPAPGEKTIPMEDLIGKDVGDVFHIPQKELDSASHKEMLNTLFNALSEVASDAQINISGINFGDKNINEFNKLLNALAFDIASNNLPKMMGLKVSEVTPEVEEMIQGYSEAISSLVKKNFGLPSEASVFNAARHGVDKEEIGKVYSEIIRISDKIIKALNSKINANTPEATPEQLAEVRDIIKKALLESKK